MNFEHEPVLLSETIEALNVRPGGVWVDATAGLGGHAAKIAEKINNDGTIVLIDADNENLERAKKRIEGITSKVYAVNGNFREICGILGKLGIEKIRGIMFDLGVSSVHFDDASRGFSFAKDAPLDMRLNTGSGRTAADIVNGYSFEELERVIREYGEDKNARKLARLIEKERPFTGTLQLAELAKRAYGAAGRAKEKIHPATRLFQALRIEVNAELDALQEALEQLPGLVEPSGRIAVISFHSLEDRIVKRFFAREASGCICENKRMPCSCGHVPALRIITKKPVEASQNEIIRNPRARSAKLRAAEKI